MNMKDALSFGMDRLEKAGIPDAKTDAFLLLEAVTGFRRADYLLRPEQELSSSGEEQYIEYIRRRTEHEPCQYIIGSCGFYGLEFLVNEHVLIPRQDTEVLVEESLRFAEKNTEVLDLCTGSGAIAIALKANRPDLSVTAVDLSEGALAVARKNAEQNKTKIRFLESDLFEDLEPDARFDLIVSNPPYISEEEYETLMPEVKDYEPELALKAGKEGLDIYRRLIREAPERLNPKGVLLVEIGFSQAEAVSELFREAGFSEIKVRKDLAGLDRVVTGRHEAETESKGEPAGEVRW